ncbi:S8 family serine peptidase [Actinokineospora sp. UTMC 2448]|uniref:S8 family serine peptidase n=1 Tax=Actinokineospora sp. UTMC 2448 TaxID=2268449 RepID=UPI00216439CD|nr:S8 family serine peptidase [Actinokineospora sp. UTMC 2448]
MRTGRRLWTSSVVLAVTAATITPTASAAPQGPSLGTTVTLLTGDKVTLIGARAHIRPGAGRGGVQFLQHRDVEGDLHVVPSDVAVEVAAGSIDRRLFDVSDLIRAGLDDARSPSTPLIITGPGVAEGGRALPSIDSVAVKADKSTAFLGTARTAGATTIWLDGPVRATLDRSVPQIGAPSAWAAGHTGADATVAVLDSGVDETHPDLAGAVVGARDFTGSGATDDRFGHGTHVAATITGDGRYRGVAPDARLLNGKVLDDTGTGSESGVIAGMEWAAAQGADVINLSLGSPFPSDGTDPMALAVNRITADTGALFVVSAGNAGPADGSIGSPGAADAALTVGAVDRADALAGFSSRGPRAGDAAIKPDLTAPGVGIVAARAAHGVIGDPVDERHVALSGTSMATPHVAGAAAILAAQHPDWPPERLKGALMASAAPHAGLSADDQGAGRVDVARADTQVLTASPPSLSLGIAEWPHDVPVSRALTLHNSGTTALTLRTSADLRDVTGAEAAVVVSPSEVSVPAGGSAEVTVTVDLSSGPDGRYSGAVTATDGTTAVRTPIGVTKEGDTEGVGLVFIGPEGFPTSEYAFRFVDVANPLEYTDHDPSGSLTLRLPAGEYYVSAWVGAQPTEPNQDTYFREPSVVIDGDTELVFDARKGVPVALTVDAADARPGMAEAGFRRATAWGEINDTTGSGPARYVPSTTSAPGEATFELVTRMARPSGGDRFVGSPYQYNLRWTVDGGVPATLTRHFPDSDLIRTRTVVHGPGTGFIDAMAGGPLPYTLTEFHTPGFVAHSRFDQAASPDALPPDTLQTTVTPRPVTEPGVRGWNAAVFGPALPRTTGPAGRAATATSCPSTCRCSPTRTRTTRATRRPTPR